MLQRIAHNQELHALRFANSVWFVLHPTELRTLKDCETEPAVYRRSPRESNHFQMSLQRKQLLHRYLKTLSIGPAGGFNLRPPARS